MLMNVSNIGNTLWDICLWKCGIMLMKIGIFISKLEGQVPKGCQQHTSNIHSKPVQATHWPAVKECEEIQVIQHVLASIRCIATILRENHINCSDPHPKSILLVSGLIRLTKLYVRKYSQKLRSVNWLSPPRAVYQFLQMRETIDHAALKGRVQTSDSSFQLQRNSSEKVHREREPPPIWRVCSKK